MPDPTPMTEEDLAKAITAMMAVLRARREITKTSGDSMIATAIARRLWWSGVRFYQNPPAEMAPAHRYPGNATAQKD